MCFVVRAFVALLATWAVVGCANVPEQVPPPEPLGLDIACNNNQNDTPLAMRWELRVNPEPIVSSQPSTATLDGVAVFEEAILDEGMEVLALEDFNLVDLRATVHVRSGATGEDVTLFPDPALYEYECDFDGRPCNPGNDLPSVPGQRGNTDCHPEEKTNPCGRFIPVPSSFDCDPGGVCSGLGKTGQCERHGFCITGGVQFELQEDTGHYTAASEGKVLFGWDDVGTCATLQEEGPNTGTWNLCSLYREEDPLGQQAYEEDSGPISVRATFRGIPLAIECTMAVNCKDFDVGCRDSLPSPTPESELISFPIQSEAP